MKEFFGLSKLPDGKYGYLRKAEGAWSWQHITFVISLLAAMFMLAVYFGKKNKNKALTAKNHVLMTCAILIDGFEIVKIITLCIRTQNAMHWLYVLPLFLCSIQLIAIPMAAFCKGRVKEACLDFVLTFGILGAIFGTVGATQNYNAYPVLSMDNVFSGITHCISGFASLYIAFSGMISLKKENFPITLAVLISFSAMAYIANLILDYNYMFLMRHDGTPYSIIYNLVKGSPVLYPLTVVGIFVAYLYGFYKIYHAVKNKAKAQASEDAQAVKI